MRVYSVTTQAIDSNNRLDFVSKTLFKIKPDVPNFMDPFYHDEVERSVSEHISQKGVSRFIVTIKTSAGTFIKTYKGDA